MTHHSLIEELQEHVSGIFHEAEQMRQDGCTPDDVDNRIDAFELAWLVRLAQEQNAEIRGSRNAVALYATSVGYSESLRSTSERLAELANLSAEERGRLSKADFLDLTIRTNDVAKETAMLMDAAIHGINVQYAILHDDFDQATETIRNGREPAMLMKIWDDAVAREQRPATNRLHAELINQINSDLRAIRDEREVGRDH